MHDQLVIGVIEADQPTEPGLAQAAKRQPGLTLKTLAVDDSASDAVAALIVDVPVQNRADVLQRLTPRWRVPILFESPVGLDLESARAVVLACRDEDAMVSANPLRYALHTRRLLDEVARADDPLHTFFAAWRFRAQSNAEHALAQLLDYLQALLPRADQPVRISAMQHLDPSVLTVTFRYAADVLGSIELGSHLPASFPSGSELIVECFSEASAFTCMPGKQSVQLYGDTHAAYDWRPEPADTIIAAFAAWLRGGPRPTGSLSNDVTALRLADRIGQAVQAAGVLDVQAV